ncbi:MAG: acyltransferase [Lachnospiraceae bacterium]|nr:acyltransferase [Lachnospiraceae bacterium]
MISIKKMLKKLVYKEKLDSESYIKYLRQQGAKIGKRVNIYAPNKTLIDMTRPWLIDIGDDVQITENVTILTHGYDWSVLKGVYGEVLGSSGGVKIGNNVFIGMKTTILKGVHIGNNVIIGANSLVNKDIPDNCVAAGNPAKVIMPLDQYYEKRKKEQLAEATELVQLYRERYGKEPDDKALHEFFWLFCDGTDELPDCWKSMMALIGNEEYSYKRLKNNKKKFQDKDSFLKSIK